VLINKNNVRLNVQWRSGVDSSHIFDGIINVILVIGVALQIFPMSSVLLLSTLKFVPVSQATTKDTLSDRKSK